VPLANKQESSLSLIKGSTLPGRCRHCDFRRNDGPVEQPH